jgi:hypothetical protein
MYIANTITILFYIRSTILPVQVSMPLKAQLCTADGRVRYYIDKMPGMDSF